MKKPHESITESLPPRNRLAASLELYHKLIEAKKTNLVDDKLLSDHTNRLLRNMEHLDALMNKYPQLEEDCHMKSHQKFNEEVFEPKQGFADEHRMAEMAKPRRVVLKNTLQAYRDFMSQEKQERIELLLGDEPENVAERIPRVKRKNRREDAIKLLQQIEKKITYDLFNEVASNVMKRVPEMIAEPKQPRVKTHNRIKLRKQAFEELSDSNGAPRDEGEEQLYKAMASVIGGYVEKTLAQTVSPKAKKIKNPKKLKSVEKNENLIKIAQSLMTRIWIKNELRRQSITSC